MPTKKEEEEEQAFFLQKLKEQEQAEKKHTTTEKIMTNKTEKPEKRMTHREAIEELTDLIGTPVPVIEADQLRKQLSTVGDADSELPPEMDAAVKDLKRRAKDSAAKK